MVEDQDSSVLKHNCHPGFQHKQHSKSAQHSERAAGTKNQIKTSQTTNKPLQGF
jgi:hypothetical protein